MKELEKVTKKFAQENFEKLYTKKETNKKALTNIFDTYAKLCMHRPWTWNP